MEEIQGLQVESIARPNGKNDSWQTRHNVRALLKKESRYLENKRVRQHGDRLTGNAVDQDFCKEANVNCLCGCAH